MTPRHELILIPFLHSIDYFLEGLFRGWPSGVTSTVRGAAPERTLYAAGFGLLALSGVSSNHVVPRHRSAASSASLRVPPRIGRAVRSHSSAIGMPAR
jgi:hypothetical protein